MLQSGGLILQGELGGGADNPGRGFAHWKSLRNKFVCWVLILN
jgi:hypothetical protein